MPGVTQRKYVGETMRIHKALKRPLYLVAEVLPCEYTGAEFLTLFKELYPFDWKQIDERCKLYKEKDLFLKKVGKKTRYKSPSSERFFFDMPVVRNILSPQYKTKHKNSFDEEARQQKLDTLRKSRSAKIMRVEERVSDYTQLMQEIEPYYVDALIVAYHQKGITTQGKMEILVEMGKFICEKSIRFFYKINDAERNDQIRNIAFNHLQKSGHYVRLRKNFKGKRKSYTIETTTFDMTPLDLVRRLEEDSVQNKKRFGAFISHSFKDAGIVRKVIAILNTKGVSCYCDWSSDNDFLKRDLVSDYTKEVLKKRIEQSDKVIFIRTSNSMTGLSVNSPWIELELEHCKTLDKPVYYIDLLNDGEKLPYTLLKQDIDNNNIDWSM